MQEHIHTGRIAGLVIFRVPEFGARASFTIEGTGRSSIVCAVEGDVAREFITRYCEGDEVSVRGIYEPRPSTASANSPWVSRFRIRAAQLAKEHLTAASRGTRPELPKEVHEERNRAAKPCYAKAVLLPALSVLFLLTSGVIIEAQELLAPIPVPPSRGATSADAQDINKLRQLAGTQSPFDTASLPPIPTISAGSDIRSFLSAGVPADLKRAALRRAWSVDATIRDFIGLSENSWDFNAGGVLGFGSLTAEDSRRLLARVMEAKESLDATASSATAPTGSVAVGAGTPERRPN